MAVSAGPSDCPRPAGRGILWNQFILARAVARTARQALERARPEEGAEPDSVTFCFTDTHAGCGRIEGPLPALAEVMALRTSFTSPLFFDALDQDAAERDWHPGSWILATRVLHGLGDPRLSVEIDVNDIDHSLVAQAGRNREQGWVRFWTHDWYQFLLSRLALPRPPQFVFIDPPADDARGPGYAMDAAILLDTLAVPYVVTYRLSAPQEVIDQIGRTGLELITTDGGMGVLLGGGAEGVLLEILPDLRQLATALGGSFTVRLPSNIDYSI